MTLDRKSYVAECRKRWAGGAFTDARQNFDDFEEIRETLVEALREFKRNPSQAHFSGKAFGNPEGTLTAFLWALQTAIQPDLRCLAPLLDFEEHFQNVFLRRGLLIYCTMILRELEKPETVDSKQTTMPIHSTSTFSLTSE